MFPRLFKSGPCACVLLCLLVAPPLFSWMTELMAPNQVTLDLGGMDIPAVYKQAMRYEDGSIDLTINIPASMDVLRRLLDHQEQIRYNLTVRSRTDDGNTEDGIDPSDDSIPKTRYPVTLDTPYVLNSPNVCQGVDPLHVLVIVHTSTANFQRRRLIRETWAGKNLMNTRNLRVVFLLGMTPNTTVQRQIENERLVYEDLVQGQFKDSYHNLTHKGVMAYRWIQHHCPAAQLILKVDDDIYMNPFLLHHVYFPKLRQMNRTIACHVRPKYTSPIQRRTGKWQVEDFQFRGYKYYPVDYCNGYVVIITPDIVRAMYSAAYTTPFFWVDDVYLYGLLPAKVGNVTHLNIVKNMTLSASAGLKCYSRLNCTFLASTAPKQSTLNEMWRLTLAQIPEVIKPDVNPVYLVT